MAIFVNDGSAFSNSELNFLERIREMKIPVLVAFNKRDLRPPDPANLEYCKIHGLSWVSLSASNKEKILEAKEKLVELAPQRFTEDRPLVRDIVKPGDRVILVTPIDSAAPKGRLILPQVQVLRDLLDAGAVAVVTRELELKNALAALKEIRTS